MVFTVRVHEVITLIVSWCTAKRRKLIDRVSEQLVDETGRFRPFAGRFTPQTYARNRFSMIPPERSPDIRPFDDNRMVIFGSLWPISVQSFYELKALRKGVENDDP